MTEDITLSPMVAGRIDAVCERFEEAWKDGQPQVEEFLTAAPDPEKSLWLRGLLEIEIEVLRTRGVAVRLEDYLSRFPGREAIVRAAFNPSAGMFAIVVPAAAQETAAHTASGTHPGTGMVSPSIGDQFGRYEIRAALGAGAMGSVFQAFDTELKRIVALKVPKPQPVASEVGKSRFLREARAAAALQHRHLCPVYDVGIANGLPYITMGHLSGGTLSAWIGSQRTPVEVAELVGKIALALDHAHRQGIVHRDLKPSNIMFDAEGQPVVTDFGLAYFEDVQDASATVAGEVYGTPTYMSPEQAQGNAHLADGRMDVYSMGVVLFQLLTGELPFRGKTREVLQQVIHDEPPSLRQLNRQIPRDLETICLKCLAKEPRRRYATAGELGADLQRFVEGRPIQARPVGRVEQTWRWCKRSPIVASLAVGLVLALIFGTTVSSFFALRARHQKKQAENIAEQLLQFIQTLRLVASLHNPIDFDSFRTRPKPVDSPELKALLTNNNARLKNLEQEPESKAEMLNAVGTVCRGIGEYDLAIVYLDQAIQIRRRLGQTVKRELADSLVQYGWLQRETKHYAAAESALREALKLNDGNEADWRFFAIAEFHLAWILADRGSQEDPKLLKESLERFQAVAERVKAKTGEKSKDYAVAMIGVAVAHFANGDDNKALATAALSHQYFLSDASGAREPASKVFALYASINIVRKQGDLVQAEKYFRQAIELAEQIVDEQHPFLRMPVAFLKADFAGLLRDMKKDGEAEKVARQSLGVIRNSPVRGHLEVIRALIQFGDRLRGRGNPEDLKEALALYSDAAKFGTVSLGPNHHFVIDAKSKHEVLSKELQK